ncbi:S41 family peptidase [uncultured Bacteroides sp.]|uniref:S41 family peptidase n=1 Tax=uncultured Bacteroides sp. TaxID=162156 RepID=UPI002AAAD73F|nr:S41 family peptidase [uncultured Bacteroides sp.]
MKKYSSILLLLSGVIFTAIFTSCKGEDRTLEYKDTKGVNDWVYGKMKDYYLWYDEIPISSKLNFYADPDVFFYTLLSSKEKKNSNYYSWIEQKEITTKSIDEKSSYGFEFVLYTLNSIQYARVLYVLPGSPASDAGLKRGDWILSLDGQSITTTNYTQLLTGSGAKLTLGLFTGNAKSPFVESGSLTLSAARAVNNDPILVNKVLTSASGSKIGYLMYTHFATGPNDNAYDYTYEKELRQAFASFKNQNVQDFVLDLRYNPGGYITNSQLLSTMLAPSSSLGKTFCVIKYNDKMNPSQTTYKFEKDSIKEGANLNLSRLYVLVSNYTASASELLINGLKPFMNVTLIGTTTEGKNLGSITIEDDNYNWILQPIVGKLYNSEDKSDYGSGFTPDVKLDETANYDAFMELGNENEIMLKQALALINGASVSTAASTKSFSTLLNIGQSSLDRKKTNGVRLSPIKR